MSEVCKTGACPLDPMGTKVYHKPIKTYHSFLWKKQPWYSQNFAKRVFLTQPRLLWKAYCPFKVERKNTGRADWDFLKVPRVLLGLGHENSRGNLYVTKECEGKFKVKKAAVCYWRQEGMACPKVFAAHVKVVYLRYCAYLVYQKDLSLCYSIIQTCHSGLFLGKQTSFQTPTSINFPAVTFPLQAKASQFQY